MLKKIKQENPDILALSVVSADYSLTIDAAKIAKEINKNIIIIVG